MSVRKSCYTCKNYRQEGGFCENSAKCGEDMDYWQISEVYRETETVPVVTEKAEPTIKIALDKLTTIADSEFEKALENGTVKLVYETEHDAVNHPSHYTAGGIECIDCIKSALGENFMGFLIGNVIKYAYRYRNKNGLEDLKKARWYLDRAIKEVEGNE